MQFAPSLCDIFFCLRALANTCFCSRYRKVASFSLAHDRYHRNKITAEGRSWCCFCQESQRKTFRFFSRKASSKSTAKPRCFGSVVGNHRSAAPCEVCDRSVCVFRINALNLKHFYNVGRSFSRQRIFAVFT